MVKLTPWRGAAVLGLALVLGAVAAACQPGDAGNIRSTGAYPIDIFQEMHYNQSFKSQEPPRLAPPAQAVPYRGFAEEPATNVEELALFVTEVPLPRLKLDAQALLNPVPPTGAVLDQAVRLYNINCAVCHGATAKGDRPVEVEEDFIFVGDLFREAGATKPPDFGSPRILALSPGEVYWSMTNGFIFMPAFGGLLTPEERWTLVHLVGLLEDEREALLGSGAGQ